MTTVGLADIVPETYKGRVVTFLVGWTLTGAWGKLCKLSLLISVIYLQRLWESHNRILKRTRRTAMTGRGRVCV